MLGWAGIASRGNGAYSSLASQSGAKCYRGELSLYFDGDSPADQGAGRQGRGPAALTHMAASDRQALSHRS